MEARRGYALAAALAAVALGTTAATAQTPTETEALSITLKVSPRVQLADFGETVTLTGKVTGGPLLAAALADRDLELEYDATALGYNRKLDLEPITPKPDGTFRKQLDVAVNTRIVLKPAEGSAFTGQSPAVTTHWKALPEISNYPRGKRLVMEFRASIPGGIPFATGGLTVRRGSAKRAIFYAGSCGRLSRGGGCTKPHSRIQRVGSAPLKSAYDGEVHAKLSRPFSALPKVPRGHGGRLYACVDGQPFLGIDPETKCGGRTTTGRIAPPE